jgi:hypothetical protein
MVSRRVVVLSLLLLCASTVLRAQAPAASAAPGRFARIVVIAPKPGEQGAFEEGYQRHLAWHRAHADPWPWYGWSIVLGDRLGLFMDGTFGHASADFDAAVDPAGDAADNAANVAPHADFLSHGVYERLDSLGMGAPLPDTTALLALTTYDVLPGRERRFEDAISARRARLPRETRFTWYRLRLGGRTPRYLLLRAVPRFSDAAELPDFFEDPSLGTPSWSSSLDTIVEEVRTELLRYRPTLSYHP